MKKLAPLLLFTALAATSVSATPVTIQLTGTSGVSDGSDYVLPYFISINGGPSISADCYDFFDDVSVGQSWTANALTLSEAAATGQFSSDPNALADYELVDVLSTLATATPQDQIDLQHDIWNVFDPGTFTPDAGMTAYLSTATAEVPTFNYSNAVYIEGAPGDVPAVQAFVMQASSDTLVFSPEPSTTILIGLGLIGIGVGLRRRAARV